ncbi:hypothetical protein [Nocardioides sp. SYSU DS0663]|uniref:hypothetical protein n=1 Tax=Nocardioides sp. SYSU DS0663 TaxID=3416445 RepID=UPI003F4AFF65
MSKRVHVSAALASVLMTASVALGVNAAHASGSSQDEASVSHQQASRATSRGATLRASAREVQEGDRLALTAVIKSPGRAGKVTLHKWQVPPYNGEPTWEPVKTLAVRGKRTLRFAVVATGLNIERYRAVVSYRGAKPVRSKPVGVIVWRWIPLSRYTPYYEAEPYAAGFGTTQINGHSYNGWGPRTYSHTGTWESRFTAGRHCKTFRGVLGVADISHDESSGLIRFTADDAVVYESPALTPGMDLLVSVALAKPYRFGIQAFDTTPGGTAGRDAVEAWPVIGDPALLCTGV